MSVATSTRMLPRLNDIQRPLAGALRLVAVNRVGADAVAVQLLGDAVGAVLRAGEDQHARHLRVAQHLAQQRALVAAVDVQTHWVISSTVLDTGVTATLTGSTRMR